MLTPGKVDCGLDLVDPIQDEQAPISPRQHWIETRNPNTMWHGCCNYVLTLKTKAFTAFFSGSHTRGMDRHTSVLFVHTCHLLETIAV